MSDDVLHDYIASTERFMERLTATQEAIEKNLTILSESCKTQESSILRTETTLQSFKTEVRTDHKYMNKFLLFLLLALIMAMGSLVGIKIVFPQAL